MTDEEMNKKMEFIVEQQAKFAADIEMTREVQARDSILLKDGMLGLMDVVGSLARVQQAADDRINLLTSAQARSDENISRLAEAESRLTEAQARTEERLNIFINVVERYISGNGGAESPA